MAIEGCKTGYRPNRDGEATYPHDLSTGVSLIPVLPSMQSTLSFSELEYRIIRRDGNSTSVPHSAFSSGCLAFSDRDRELPSAVHLPFTVYCLGRVGI